MKYISLAVLFTALFACAHVNRAPASTPALTIACDQAMEHLGAESLLARGEDADFRFVTLIGHLQYLLNVYLPEMKKNTVKPSEGAVVEFKRMLEDWDEFRQDDKERARVLKFLKAQVENGPFFHDPEYASKLACVYKCDEPAKCEKKCKATGFKDISQAIGVTKAAVACSEIQNENAVFQSAEFEASFKRHQAQILQRHKRIVALTEEMIALEDKVEKAFRPLAKDMAKFKVKPAPKKYEATDFEKKMEPFVVLLDTNAGRGSGFLVSGRDKTKLITAYHVFGYDLRVNWGPEKVEVFFRDDLKAAKASGKEIEMAAATPGQFTRMNDVIINPYPDSREGLKVVAKGRLPEKDQKFFALGYPATTEGALRAIPCTFLGFSQSSQGQGTRYSFICDSGRDRFNGMSGGPIVDEDGTVWGVSTNVGVAMSRILVGSPVFRDEDGAMKAGLPQYGMNDLCLNPKNWAVYEHCQLMENQYETHIP